MACRMIKPTNLIAAGTLSRNLAIFFNVWAGNNEQFAVLSQWHKALLSFFLYTLAFPSLSGLFTPILLSKECLEGQYKFHRGWRAT